MGRSENKQFLTHPAAEKMGHMPIDFHQKIQYNQFNLLKIE